MAGHLAAAAHPTTLGESAAIDKLLSEVKRQRRSLMFAEAYIKYDQSPFRSSKSPLQVTGLSKSKRHSVAPGHESHRSRNDYPYNSEWARTSPAGEHSVTSMATLAPAPGRRAPLRANLQTLGKRSESLAVGFAK